MLLPNGKLKDMDDSTDRTLDAVGPRLKQLRQRRDITLSDLAEETGISTSTLSRLEAGLRRPTLEQLLPLARAYGVTLRRARRCTTHRQPTHQPAAHPVRRRLHDPAPDPPCRRDPGLQVRPPHLAR